MPSTQKTLHYLGSAVLTAIAVGLLGFGMSADWSTTTFTCALSETNGSAVVTLGLFYGVSSLDDCPFDMDSPVFEAIDQLGEIALTPVALQITVVALLALCLLCSAATMLVSLYNSVSNPYETFMGPRAIYACSSLSAVFSASVLVLHACHVFLANVSKDILFKNFESAELGAFVPSLQVGYFMAIPYFVLSLSAVALVYKYQHTSYSHQKKQQKPTEDAPKEIMMY